jgi:catechol 2,3-dioxygenase-like lactoylglutathione lyase family enzyme
MPLRRLLAPLIAALLLATQSWATWSICVINLRTGEMCVASATCVDGTDLLTWTPMIIPGVGIAVTQAASPQQMKVTIHDFMLLGHSPARLSKRVDQKYGNVGARQYAILDMQGRVVVHTGNTNGVWAGHLIGQDGDLLYTIQGNVLAGEQVILEAESAFLSTPGDLSQRIMAAMEAAASMGGDGRCSCSERFPDSCGTPPPGTWQSAVIGYMAISRPGDDPGTCSVGPGCANGDFFMVLNEPNHVRPSTDPVVLLRADYDAWRLDQIGRPDAMESIVIADTQTVNLNADPVNYWVELYDIDGLGLTHGGATLTLEHQPGSTGMASLNSVTDHGDGSYTLEVQPGNRPGLDHFAFRVDDGQGTTAQLWPSQNLLHEAGPVAPINNRTAVPGLAGVQEIRAAHMLPDGLRLWMIADLGNGFELARAQRASVTDPFGMPIAQTITNTPSGRLESLWISDDELQLSLSARDENDLEELYESRRDTLNDSFSEPKSQAELSSGLGEGSPWVSRNGLSMIFSSGRDGQSRLYRAQRLSTDAVWYPPHPLSGLVDGQSKGEAILIDGDTRMIYTDKVGWRTALRYARVLPEHGWQLGGLQPGQPSTRTTTIGLSADGRTLWSLVPGQGPGQILQAKLAAASMQADGRSLSFSNGGRLTFELHAGADLALANYEVLVGSPGSGMYWHDLVLSISPHAEITRLLQHNAGSGVWADFRGNLDAAGNASVVLDLPAGELNDPALIGQTLALCFVANPTGTGFVSNAVEVIIEP